MHEIRSSILGGESKPSSPVARKAKPKREGEGLGGLTKIAIKRQEARVTDQRCEDRLRDVVESTTIVFRRKKQDARVVNVSSRGAMIQCDIEPRIGEKIDIQFTEDSKTRCVVRWVREGRIGLEFVDETILWDCTRPQEPVLHYRSHEGGGQPQASEAAAPRGVVEREQRQTLLRKGTLYWGGITIPVRLRNISAGGAKVESEQELVAGAEVELDLGEAGYQMAEVRWSKEGQVGLRFAEAFDLGSLAPAPAVAVPGGAPDMLKPAYLETELRADSPWAARFERLSTTDLRMINPEE